jgi:hypothetical protein
MWASVAWGAGIGASIGEEPGGVSVEVIPSRLSLGGARAGPRAGNAGPDPPICATRTWLVRSCDDLWARFSPAAASGTVGPMRISPPGPSASTPEGAEVPDDDGSADHSIVTGDVRVPRALRGEAQGGPARAAARRARRPPPRARRGRRGRARATPGRAERRQGGSVAVVGARRREIGPLSLAPATSWCARRRARSCRAPPRSPPTPGPRPSRAICG